MILKFVKSLYGFISKLAYDTLRVVRDILSVSMAQYIVIIVSAIGFFAMMQPIYDNIVQSHFPDLPKFISEGDFGFIDQFLQWFGVLYGFLLPLILVRVWEQFDDIDNVFDREADAIRILAEDMLLLRDENKKIRRAILDLLKQYANHVLNHHEEESILASKTKGEDPSKKDVGGGYLQQIREQYKVLIHQTEGSHQEGPSLISEFLDKLNTIIDLRGDRISLSTQRLFESLKVIAVVTTILWIIPLYFLIFTEIGILNKLLIVVVIFLVIVILSIIDDLDKPFDGLWRVDIESWEKLSAYFEEMSDNKPSFETLQLRYFPIRVRQNKFEQLRKFHRNKS